MKLYVREIRTKNADGETLIKVKTYVSKPKKPFYILWI